MSLGTPSPMRYNFTARRCKNCGRYFAQTGRISDEAFYAWSEQARAQKKKYDEGTIALEDFQRWLKES